MFNVSMKKDIIYNSAYDVLAGETTNFQIVTNGNNLYLIFLGLCTFLIMLEYLHILRYNRTIAVMVTAISSTGTDLLSMGLCVLIVVMAFFSVAYIQYGPYLEQFSTMKITFVTLISSFMGKFDFNSIQVVAGNSGRVFLLLYLLVMIFLMVNLFITLLCTVLDAVKNDKENRHKDHEVVDYFLKTVKQFIKPDEDDIIEKEHDDGHKNERDTLSKQLNMATDSTDDYRGEEMSCSTNSDTCLIHKPVPICIQLKSKIGIKISK